MLIPGMLVTGAICIGTFRISVETGLELVGMIISKSESDTKQAKERRQQHIYLRLPPTPNEYLPAIVHG